MIHPHTITTYETLGLMALMLVLLALPLSLLAVALGLWAEAVARRGWPRVVINDFKDTTP